MNKHVGLLINETDLKWEFIVYSRIVGKLVHQSKFFDFTFLVLRLWGDIQRWVAIFGQSLNI